MDPTACLKRIISASRIDRDEYSDACEDLAGWLKRGGFKPTLPKDLAYIPGTGTLWSLLSPAAWSIAKDKWTLVRWNVDGSINSSYLLED